MRMRYLLAAASLVLGVRLVGAQSASAHLALGDRANSTMNAQEALAHFEAVTKAEPDNYEALWKASREAIDIAEFESNRGKSTQLYKTGELYARRALAARPDDAEGHFYLARALGKVALTLGSKERVKYAKDVRSHALEALKVNPVHSGALHVMGRWHAEVMRLNGLSRFFAKNFLGGSIFNSASWKEAVSYMEKSVELDPDRLTHHLDLGEIYADVNQPAKARAQFQIVISAQEWEYNDKHYKRQARERLERLK